MHYARISRVLTAFIILMLRLWSPINARGAKASTQLSNKLVYMSGYDNILADAPDQFDALWTPFVSLSPFVVLFAP
eukprot:2789890-Heterocapsa_arctica.AAC.1